MDTAQWPQGIGIVNKLPTEAPSKGMVERRCRPPKYEALNCPRCKSSNTKFCYYNNYSLSQPRYFCKTCRRYWTAGGSLRNVPVGGGSRKNNKSSLTNPISKLTPTAAGFPNSPSHQKPKPKIHETGQDLNLAYPPPSEDWAHFCVGNKSNPQNSSAMELLKSGINDSRGLSSFMSMLAPVSDPTGFPVHDFKPISLNFSLDGFETHHHDYGSFDEGVQESSGARLLFPMVELKQQVPSTTSNDQLEQEESPASTARYWNANGMLGGGQHW